MRSTGDRADPIRQIEQYRLFGLLLCGRQIFIQDLFALLDSREGRIAQRAANLIGKAAFAGLSRVVERFVEALAGDQV